MEGIAIDWLSQVVYWIESSSAHHAIMAATIKGRFKKTLFSADVHHRMYDLVVDPPRG